MRLLPPRLRTASFALLAGLLLAGVARAQTPTAPPPPAKTTKQAGPLWNNGDATRKCPGVCAPDKWTGQWWTTVPNKMSVCECQAVPPPPPPPLPPPPPAPAFNKVTKEAGPLWNNGDANGKCPGVCAPNKWSGQWWTTVPNKMSVCECLVPAPQKFTKEAGPIWNNGDANGKCPKTCGPAKWTGQWWTTVPNKMSVCECVNP